MVYPFILEFYALNTQMHIMRSCVTLLVIVHCWGRKISEDEMNGYVAGLVEVRKVGPLFYFVFYFFIFYFFILYNDQQMHNYLTNYPLLHVSTLSCNLSSRSL